MRRAATRAAAALGALIAALPTASPAAAAAGRVPGVELHVRFAPDVRGASTTIHYGFTISQPAPLRSMELRLPAGMSFAKASLGLAECSPGTLRRHGPSGCPPNSLIGFGTAYAEVAAEQTVKEQAALSVLLGPPDEGHPTVLFFVEGIYPAVEELALRSEVLPVAQPFEYALKTEVPQLTLWPGGPDVSLMGLHTTIGPHGLHYHYVEHGREIAFTPRGLNVPYRCPQGGYPVQARFRWWGIAQTATATTQVPCGRRPAGPQRAR